MYRVKLFFLAQNEVKTQFGILCHRFLSNSPWQIKSLKVVDIIRGGLRRFSDSLGQLWNSLADFFIRSGHFEKVGVVLEIIKERYIRN